MYMGIYKITFQSRIRFFWPKVQNMGKVMCSFPRLQLVKIQPTRTLIFVVNKFPFYIVHIDIWVTSKLSVDLGSSCVFLNVMCDLTQFVVSVIVADATAEFLAKLFIEQVVFTFGLVAVVVVEADRIFFECF